MRTEDYGAVPEVAASRARILAAMYVPCGT
jgi:hypothetical protein